MKHCKRITVEKAQDDGIDLGPLSIWIGSIIAWFKFSV
jgi:hypothetical protein